MSLSTQFYTMLAMIAMGSFFGGSLDTYQRFLKRGHRKRIIVFLNDLLFWVIHALITFYVLFIVNQGELRFYLLLALLCGFSAYQALLKNIYLRILEQMIRFLKSTMRLLKRTFDLLIFRPIRALVLMTIALLLFIGKVLLALVKIVYKVLLWIFKVIFYPVKLLCKGISYFIPQSVKKFVVRISMIFAGYLRSIKNVINKAIEMIQKIIKK